MLNLKEGSGYLPNWLNFRKSSEGRRGSFSIKKSILQILDLNEFFFSDVFREKYCNIIFSENEGGEAVWNFFVTRPYALNKTYRGMK